MAVQNEVREEVLDAFQDGERLGAREIMARTGRGRIVYRWISDLVRSGDLVIVGEEGTKRRPRRLYARAGVSPF